MFLYLMPSKNTNRTEHNMNELSGSPREHGFSALPTFLKAVYDFRFDVVQKTKKTEKNLNELSGSPGKLSFLASLTLLETLYLLT